MTRSAACRRTSRSGENRPRQRDLERDRLARPRRARPRSPRPAPRTAAPRRCGPVTRLLGEHLLLGLGEQVRAVAARGAQVVAGEVEPVGGEQLLGALVVERRPLELEEQQRASRSPSPRSCTLLQQRAARRVGRVGGEAQRRVVARRGRRAPGSPRARCIAATRPGPSSSATLPACAPRTRRRARWASSSMRRRPRGVGCAAVEERVNVDADREQAVRPGTSVGSRRPCATVAVRSRTGGSCSKIVAGTASELTARGGQAGHHRPAHRSAAGHFSRNALSLDVVWVQLDRNSRSAESRPALVRPFLGLHSTCPGVGRSAWNADPWTVSGNPGHGAAEYYSAVVAT